jgi:hypothetical protein
MGQIIPFAHTGLMSGWSPTHLIAQVTFFFSGKTKQINITITSTTTEKEKIETLTIYLPI